MSTLIIVENTQGGAPTWMLASSAKDISISTDPVPAWSQKASRKVYVTSGVNVDHSVVSSVSRSDRETRTAALFTLEDSFAEPPENMHVALGGKIEGTSELWIATCSKSFMDDIVSSANETDLKDLEIVSDVSLFLNLETDTIISSDDRVLVINGRKALSVEPDNAEELLPALLSELKIDTPVLEGPSPVRSSSIRFRQSSEPEDENDQQFLARVARQVLDGRGINLRQAEYAVRARSGLKIDRIMTVGVLASLMILMWAGVLFLETQNLQSAADRQLSEARAAYMSAYPEEGTVADPRAQLRRKLAAVGSNGPAFTELSALLSGAITELGGVELISLNYTDVSNELTATLAFADYESREVLKSAVENRGATLTLGASRQTDTAIVGDVVVRVR